MAERLQKVLARAGHGSRRQVETWIREGRITVNGKPAEIGISVSATDKIRLDGKAVSIAATSDAPRTLLYHKPAGELTTRKDEAGALHRLIERYALTADQVTRRPSTPPIRGLRRNISAKKLNVLTAEVARVMPVLPVPLPIWWPRTPPRPA